MIKTEVNENINNLIQIYFEKSNMLDLKPVLAGGFPLALWKATRVYDTPDKWNELVRVLRYSKRKFQSIQFGDIDIWFMDDQFVDDPIHLDTKELLSKNYKNTELVDVIKNNDLLFRNFSINSFTKSTKYANSFQMINSSIHSGSSFQVQVIKNKISSIESLLSSFDLTICKIAWHDGVIYYDENISREFDNFELSMNKEDVFSAGDIYNRMFNANRAFKYSDRYLLDFNEKMMESIVSLYIEAKDVKNQSDNDVLNSFPASSQPVINIGTTGSTGTICISPGTYGLTAPAIHPYGSDWKLNARRTTLMTFFNNFSNLTRMKNYKKEYGLFLIDRLDIFPQLKVLLNVTENAQYTLPF